MSAQPARGYLGISEVLAQLRADFPDISVSKIRFLETEGLIAPARSAAGYRRFVGQDVDRLRLILAAQRDQYLPLRVIRERLARLDHQAADPAGSTASAGQGHARPPGPAGQDGHAPMGHTPVGRPGTGRVQGDLMPGAATSRASGASPAARPTALDQGMAEAAGPAPLLSRRELLDVGGITEALLTELETFGLLRRVGRNYGPDALEVARTAAALASFGVEARHLRAVRAAAERESTMIESLVAPIQRQRGRGAREQAGRTARDCAALVLRLHAALVEGALAEAGLAEAGLAEAVAPEAGLLGRPAATLGPVGRDFIEPEMQRQQARGVGGASA